MPRLISILVLALLWVSPTSAQDMPADYAGVLKALGKTGDYKGNVLKINIPRNDITAAVQGVLVPTPFGFGGWLAMTKGDQGMDVMMGDLVLIEPEVNPVITAVLNAGLDVTAIHNHFMFDTPRVFYVHVHGVGNAAELAKKIRPAVDLIARDPFTGATATGTELPKGLDGAALTKIVGHPGEQNGDVYKITIGRPDIDLREHGARIETRMGLNTWAAFTGSDSEAVVAGDVAMLASEVTPVLKALRSAGLQVVALHHHMTTGTPAVFFVHYWGRGDAATLARGVRGALDALPR